MLGTVLGPGDPAVGKKGQDATPLCFVAISGGLEKAQVSAGGWSERLKGDIM